MKKLEKALLATNKQLLEASKIIAELSLEHKDKVKIFNSTVSKNNVLLREIIGNTPF